MSHTPGPWDWGPHSDELVGRYEVNAGEGRRRSHICECHSNRQQTRKVADEEAAANARLIAAVPELLAMLRRGSDAVSALEADCDEHGIDCYPARHWWQDADRLIAKAEGRE